MSKSAIYPINVKPGIKRDGTEFEGDYYTDGQWCRFYRGKPKKIGGYREAYNQYEEIVRGECQSFSSGAWNYVYGGSESQLQMLQITRMGASGSFSDRTPAGFISDSNNEWKMTSIYNSSGTEMVIVAMATQTVSDISDTTNRNIYYGNIIDTSPLNSTLSISVSGGIVALPPYLFAYGNDGYLAWSDKNDITNIGGAGSGDAGEARICANKVVKGIPIRGGSGNSPSGLFWSLDTLQRISFVGTASGVFSNDTLATDISILSTNAVTDYDGIIYWPGVDRWLMYNGVVKEVENNLSLDFFYNNYNKAFPQKIFSFKVPRYGEIWTCFPMGDATECNWAIIQNVREGTWYDTPLTEGGRSAGLSPKSTFPYPLLFGNNINSIDRYTLWQHEYGVDKVIGDQMLAIESFFETCNIDVMSEGLFANGWEGRNKWTRVIRMEPDFVQSGDLEFTLKGRKFAMSPDDASKSYTYDGTTSFKIDSRKQYRQLRLRVTSNVVGGNFLMGEPVWELTEGDVRAASGSGT